MGRGSGQILYCVSFYSGKLILEEKVSLLAAVDWWRTPVIQRDDVFVPHIKTTDGPNGARGESYVSGIKAACFPCGTSLGASFDRDLLYRSGKEIAKEAKTKAANVLLAPTLNVIRSPRGGRNYETYSEDPVALGLLSAAFINGCQSEGIAATPKHFVANDTENNRKILSAEIDEQTLREIYMLPFQLLMKWSKPWCLMTSYNRVNGTYVSDDSRLVNGVVRQEWGFDGLVVSDWMGVYSTADSVNAGVDVDLPGPTQWRGGKLLQAIQDGKVSEETIDSCARRVLELAKRLGRFESPEEPPEVALQNPERDQFIREAGAQGMVLLKNENSILPLPEKATVALVGHHAFNAALGGGGSARVDSIRAVSPVEGLKEAGFNVIEAPGVPVFGALPHADPAIIYTSDTKAQTPEPVKLEWFNGHSIGQNLVHEETKALPEYMIKEKWPSYLSAEYCTRLSFAIRPTTTGEHILSIISTGPAVCYINGEKAFTRAQETDLRPESFYFFKSQLERRFTYPMQANQLYTLTLESWNTDPALLASPSLSGRLFQGSALRFHEAIDIPQRIETACTAASTAQYALVCIGTTPEIESEGFDRTSFALAPQQYDQILAVARANPNTIVANFSGSPVDLTPFIENVPALVQAWFPGQEAGHSLALVLSGKTNPSGRLPFSWPRRDEDNPSFGNFPCDEDNIVRYAEGLDVGYRFYDREETPAPLFAFGFGLSYETRFEVLDIRVSSAGNKVSSALSAADDTLEITCSVHNHGSRPGATVLQYYVSFPGNIPQTKNSVNRKRPLKELKEFQKVHIEAGASRTVSITLDKYAVSYYNADTQCWQADAGEYTVSVAGSVDEIWGVVEVEVSKRFTWSGL
ncbi:glycoside hydrolase superfamily [Aspergillus pseudoustus]|uniref:beta-glucosidase n=1 Tax=Aspergillus pseudoustus TaxID=1810923 RepID=A0ABR4J343_9EURO